MEDVAIKWAREGFERHSGIVETAAMIRSGMDEQFGPRWLCIIAPEYNYAASVILKRYLLLKMDNKYIEIMKI